MKTKQKNPKGKHVACGPDLTAKQCRQLQHVYESALERGFSKERAAKQAWGAVLRSENPPSGARGRKENGAGWGAFLGSFVGALAGAATGVGAPAALALSMAGGGVGGHYGAQPDRKKRGAVGGAVGGIGGPIFAGLGGYIGGRHPDHKPSRSKNPSPANAKKAKTHNHSHAWWEEEGHCCEACALDNPCAGKGDSCQLPSRKKNPATRDSHSALAKRLAQG